MANTQRNFIAGRMNKSLDERLIPNGEYIDALNVRLGSTEGSEVGSVENSKGNTKMTSLQYEQTASVTGPVFLSSEARCIGAYEDGKNNRVFWFVHDPAFTVGSTGKLDLIVSFNPNTQNLTYHIISIDDGFGSNTSLNFNPKHLVVGVDLVDDLLFFTDNINPPRFINITQNYTNPFYDIDQVSAEEFMVIKKPPIKAPSLILKSQINNQDDYLEERFLCFAYRYQYANGEFSATSQWSEPAFDPNVYNYSFATNLNEGMINTITGVDIVFNSGGPLVRAIQVLYKESTDTVIKVIDKLSKNLKGYADNQEYSFAFDNSKIFTVLPSTELLRLYDNVPIKALGQTIMGNRLVYGNYIEGYDLKDVFNNSIKLEYQANLVEKDIRDSLLEVTRTPGTYTFGSASPLAIGDSVIDLNFNQVDQFTQYVNGSSLQLNFVFEHSTFTGSPTPTTITENVSVTYNYLLPQTFTSLYDLVESQGFKDSIGTAANIKPVYAAAGLTSCDGVTLTDSFNCFVPTTLTTSTGSVTKFQSGIDASGDPIKILNNTPGSTSLKLQLPAIRFVQDPTSPPGSGDVYEYFKVVSAFASFSSIGKPTSLHSNRGYEIGVVYMDEFLRSSTALVSPNNTIQIPCANSDRQNQIQVTIPWGQRAPYWAKYYKFVIKPDQSTYETIFTEKFFKDPNSNDYYFLLEGENAAKVETGQRLIVKSDLGGALNNCVNATVLDKKVQSEDFLKILNPIDPGTVQDPFYLNIPAGPYMQILPQGITLDLPENNLPANVFNSSRKSRGGIYAQGFPVARCGVNIRNPDPSATLATRFVDYVIPTGSIITIEIEQKRSSATGGCVSRSSRYGPDGSKRFVTTTPYADFQTWFNSENIGNLISTDSETSAGGGQTVSNVYNSTLLSGAGLPASSVLYRDQNPYIDVSLGTNFYQFYRNTITNEMLFLATGTLNCPGDLGIGFIGQFGSSSSVEVSINVDLADQGGVVVFETVPSDAQPDIWYENNSQFNVSANGEHEGTQSNQNIQTQVSAVVDTEFFDCYAFGNGVESYTIRDSIKGEAFALGNRVTTTSGQEYKEAHRFADLTYSGLYNDESNVNRLNEFNLGLLNFKPLEDSFGSIQKLYARQTDILTLQEDKISYVLAGKDLLSDAGGTGALTSVPTVLGQQIARLEEFGISRNPESFAVFGADKFFADEQRGAIIQLKGGAYNNESLTVISEFGMRGWFRDLFHDNFDAQKLGGFDPYMNEYVLSANSITLPFVGNCDLCGSSRNITIPVAEEISYCIDVTQEVGTVNIEYILPSGGNDNIITQANTPNVGAGLVTLITETNSAAASGNSIVTEDSSINNNYTITALYNGTTTSITTKASGILSVPKNSVYAENMTILVSSDSITADTIEVTVNCPVPDEITIVQVGIGSNADRGKFIHNEYRWQDGLFISPLHQEQMEFTNGLSNPLVSQYLSLTGGQGAGVIPNDNATVSIISNKISFDDYDFKDNTNNFRFLRSSTFYGSINADIIALLAASTTATPIRGNAPEFLATFTMPSGNTEDYLYLIYDYRNSTEVQLCYSSVDLNDVCCVGCNINPTPVPTPEPEPQPIGCVSYTLSSSNDCDNYQLIATSVAGGAYSFTNCEGVAEGPINLTNNEERIIRAQSGTFSFTGDISSSFTPGVGSNSNTFTYLGCNGTPLQETVSSGLSVVRCSQSIPVIDVGVSGSVTVGSSCGEYYYTANQCGGDFENTVFLSANISLGLFNVGDVVYYDEINTSGVNVSDRRCAEITQINSGNGGSGEIIGIASACQDPVNCPSETTLSRVWMFSRPKNAPEDLIPCTSIMCIIPVFSEATGINQLLGSTGVFYEAINLVSPFNGDNNYYGYRAPLAGGSPALGGLAEGWVQISSSGRVLGFEEC